MADADPELLPMINANDKLLKALIALLAFKDEHLLDEMCIIFAAAAKSRNEIGRADAEIWAHLRKELKLISDLVDEMEDREAEQSRAGAEVH